VSVLDQVGKMVAKHAVEAVQRQPHHVVVVALDAADEDSAVVVLDAVGAGLVER